jgi:predicted transcriptional regulator of viral defense system
MAAGRPRRLDELVDALQSQGRYTFTRAEALAALGTRTEALKKAVQLLTHRRRLASPRRGFYVIVPVEYRVAGAPPASWYIDALMKAVCAPYYVGVLSAAALHGAAHQAPQEFQVVTTTRQRTVVVGRERIRFLRKRNLARTTVISVKTPTGTMQVSRPEATALDLLRYVDAAGFLSNIATVLRELAEKCDPDSLVQAAAAGVELPHVQRLGHLLDLVGVRRLSDPLARWLAEHHPDWVRLSPSEPARRARRDERWRLLVNARVEPDV